MQISLRLSIEEMGQSIYPGPNPAHLPERMTNSRLSKRQLTKNCLETLVKTLKMMKTK